MATFDGPGKGRKQCPNCAAYIGARTASCDCGHVFTPKSEKTQQKRIRIVDRTLTKCKLLDPGEDYGDYTERAGHMYDCIWGGYKEQSKEYLDKSYKENGVKQYNNLNSTLNGSLPPTWDTFVDGWGTSGLMDMASEVHLSDKQRAKSRAGASPVALLCHFLELEGVNCEIEAGGVDVLVENWLRVSLKHTMRDRENDRDLPCHVFYTCDVSNRICRDVFLKNNALMIVINPVSRFKKQESLEKDGIDLKLYSLDEGITQIKKILASRAVA